MNQYSCKTRRKSELFCRIFYIALTFAIIASGTALAEEPKLRLVSVEPTVFFIKELRNRWRPAWMSGSIHRKKLRTLAR